MSSRKPLGAAVAALALCACDPGPVALVVDVRTDLSPGVEFDTVRTEILEGSASGRLHDRDVDPAVDYVTGTRVAELEDLEPGVVSLRVALLREGAVVLERPVRADLRRDLAITIALWRDCRGVECPTPDGDAQARACNAGRCVDDRCTEENPERCGDPVCVADGDCEASGAGCAVTRCLDGACVRTGDDGACGDGEYCDPERGCRERPDAFCAPFPGARLDLHVAGDTSCVTAQGEPLRCWGAPRPLVGAPDGTPFEGPTEVLPDLRWRRFSLGRTVACGVDDGGRFVCVGEDWAGQLGDGPGESPSDTPVEPVGSRSPSAIGAGDATVCMVDASDGHLYCWGHDDRGQAATGAPPVEEIWEPTPTDRDFAWRSVDVANHHGCAVRDDGTVWCWGTNANEQLARSADTDFGLYDVSLTPILATGSDGWAAVTAGAEFNCALRDEGRLFCWGGNFAGQLGSLDPMESGGEFDPMRVEGEGWTRVEAGWRHACALRGDALFCWGDDTWEQLGPDVDGDYAWAPVRRMPDRRWVDVGAGDGHTCALDDTGRVWCWGANEEGQLGRGDGPARGVPRSVCPGP